MIALIENTFASEKNVHGIVFAAEKNALKSKTLLTLKTNKMFSNECHEISSFCFLIRPTLQGTLVWMFFWMLQWLVLFPLIGS